MKKDDKFVKIFCDGGARGNPGPAAGAFVVEADGKIIFKDAKFLGETTNNVAEYSALVMALSWVYGNLPKVVKPKIVVVMDSELVAKQMSGRFKVKNENLKNYFWQAKNLEKKIGLPISYQAVPRNKNKLPDFLVNKKLDEAAAGV